MLKNKAKGAIGRRLGLKIPLILICLYVGARSLQSYLLYSLAANGAHAVSNEAGYRSAQRGRLLTAGVFAIVEIAGGLLAQRTVSFEHTALGARLGSAIVSIILFGMITAVAVAALVWLL
jgi:hypothetical protein